MSSHAVDASQAIPVDTRSNVFKSDWWRAEMVNFSARKCVEAFEKYFNAKNRAFEAEHALRRLNPGPSEAEFMARMAKVYDGSHEPHGIPEDMVIRYAQEKKQRQEVESRNQNAQREMEECKKSFDEALGVLVEEVPIPTI